jgi:hypothetical protein
MERRERIVFWRKEKGIASLEKKRKEKEEVRVFSSSSKNKLILNNLYNISEILIIA